jgi:hypothetical protein
MPVSSWQVRRALEMGRKRTEARKPRRQQDPRLSSLKALKAEAEEVAAYWRERPAVSAALLSAGRNAARMMPSGQKPAMQLLNCAVYRESALFPRALSRSALESKVLMSMRSLCNASPSFKKEKTHAKRTDNLVWPYLPQSILLCCSGMGKTAWLPDMGRSNTSHVGCKRVRCRSGAP